jgi:hypothetical protein
MKKAVPQPAVMRKAKPPQIFRITHTFPPARADDGERFLRLVRMLLELGEKKK